MKNTTTDISLLLQQCKQKNQKAMLTVYDMYYKAMFNVSYRIVNNHELAEDIMQESFLNAFNKLDDFSNTATFGAWLKKIVINHSINELKKNAKYKLESISEKFDLQENQEIEIYFTQIKAQAILEKLQELKENYKIILTLYFIEGYDLEEITTILNISYENCKTMMSRAKESLRKKLTHNEY